MLGGCGLMIVVDWRLWLCLTPLCGGFVGSLLCVLGTVILLFVSW